MVSRVVPHEGTWIEIKEHNTEVAAIWSFPTRERGLKLLEQQVHRQVTQSFPTRERGLKSGQMNLPEDPEECRSPRGNVD